MKNTIRLVVPGNPKALKRHRACKRGKFIGTYDPSSDQKADFLQTVRDKAPATPMTGTIFLTAMFFMLRPKNHYGTGKNAGKVKATAATWHVGRPDLDNLVKFVTDALNGVFYRDDAQIAKVTAMKIYDEKPRTELLIEETII